MHHETSAAIPATASAIFEYLDDHARLAAHMTKPSWSMGGGSMRLQVDQQHGQAVGSHIELRGHIFGVELSVEEVVTAREPPVRKYWETRGTPRLLVIAGYRIGFELAPEGAATRLRVSIDYSLPSRGLARWLGITLGKPYARWCTRKMVADAIEHFVSR